MRERCPLNCITLCATFRHPHNGRTHSRISAKLHHKLKCKPIIWTTKKGEKYVPRTPGTLTRGRSARIDEQCNVRLALCKYPAHELRVDRSCGLARTF